MPCNQQNLSLAPPKLKPEVKALAGQAQLVLHDLAHIDLSSLVFRNQLHTHLILKNAWLLEVLSMHYVPCFHTLLLLFPLPTIPFYLLPDLLTSVTCQDSIQTSSRKPPSWAKGWSSTS